MNRELLDQKLYCWIKQKRIQCAIHKCLYYDFDSPILSDSEYDFLEKSLIAVEKKHPDIAEAVKQDGYLSPNDYVGFIRFPNVYEKAQWLLSLDIKKVHGFSEMQKGLTEEDLYNMVLPKIEKYPV